MDVKKPLLCTDNLAQTDNWSCGHLSCMMLLDLTETVALPSCFSEAGQAGIPTSSVPASQLQQCAASLHPTGSSQAFGVLAPIIDLVCR